ncbi:MAG: CoA transferase [Dehalococcoidia bacterium]
MADGALDDVVVLELGAGVAGPYCGRLLCDLGAQVIKVEPPGGDPARHELPIVDGESAFYHWLNAGKLNVDADDAAVDLLARRADIVVHDLLGEAAEALEARIAAVNPSTVVLSLSPYGRTGERAGWKVSPLTQYATGGYHYFAGDPKREPLALPGHHVEFHAGMHAAVAALAGLWHARATGEGQVIEISHQEAILSDQAWLTTMWTHTGQVQSRTGSAFTRCADGYVYLFPLVPYQNLFVLIERFDMLEDEQLFQPLVWQQRFGEVLQLFGEWCATRTKQQIYHAAQELRVAVSPVNTMSDIAESQQLASRDWHKRIEVAGRELIAPGFPYRMTGTPCVAHRTASARGADTHTVFAPGFAWANRAAGRVAVAGGANGSGGPLAGLRVIEVTANWAGPIAGRHLGDLGADVLKVELQTKPATRALIYTGSDVWPDFYHRSAYFNKLNRNKRAIALDLSKPQGREVFLRLVRDADVVLENNAARVMGQLGLAYDALREVNPAIVMCSMSGYGGTGPERNYSAYGSNIETASGLASVNGYGPGEYFGTGSFYADPVTGTHGSAAILAALHHSRRTGQGQWIDMSLLEAVGPFFAQEFLEFAVTGRDPEPIGNRSNMYAPQGVYPTAGTDCWLAVTARTTGEFRALCHALGRDDLASGPQTETLEGRRALQAQVDEAVRSWAASRDHITAARELQAAGVPAAPVMKNWEIISDNHLHDRGFFLTIRHPVAGTFPFPGFPWRFSKTPASLRRPAPLFAEHNQEVFVRQLGMDDVEVEALYAAGVTGNAPIYASGPQL